ncbi:MAG: hypothetical protein QHH26_06385 [Armatimonadota bacterium]|nr:hypothetical protein [Armatimonadota bacterium]
MTCPDASKVKFEIRRYKSDVHKFENDLVAYLPGLLITQSTVSNDLATLDKDTTALRFDFIEDWYSVTAFLDSAKNPTGHYHISIQSPLRNDNGVWKGDDLVLAVEVYSNWEYAILNEEAFSCAVEEGWMRIYAAANARECLRKLTLMLDEHCLPPEVMDAVGA